MTNFLLGFALGFPAGITLGICGVIGYTAWCGLREAKKVHDAMKQWTEANARLKLAYDEAARKAGKTGMN